jgi:hypothetical protein
LHEIAADRNQWRDVCDFKIWKAKIETPTSSRRGIWAELRYGTVPARVQKNYTEVPDEQTK